VTIAAATLSVIALRFEETAIVVLALLLAAATLGFLPLNWPPARVFLGDTGSLTLGFLLGATSLLENRKGTVAVTLLLPIVLLAVPLLDATLAFGRRVRQGQHPFQRDTGHLHHRLLRLGLAPRQILTLVYGVGVCLGLTAYLISVMPKQFVVVVVLILGVGGLVAVKALDYLERAVERHRGAEGSSERPA
jgi:UDP-GlcNAc:undecaprenyl-phosphate GlcNAc-1-phosphate transferase